MANKWIIKKYNLWKDTYTFSIDMAMELSNLSPFIKLILKKFVVWFSKHSTRLLCRKIFAKIMYLILLEQDVLRFNVNKWVLNYKNIICHITKQ